MPQNPASSSASMMGDPTQMMASLTPAFMNQPQYQQQMQGLAMQVRQQEEGTKKIKKFLKAYEDIQLSAPMMQPQQAPQPGFMQPPGGNVQSMNNNLPRNEPQYEEAPTSFTEMAGGSIPSEGEDDMTSYSEAPISPEEAGYSNASNETGGPGPEYNRTYTKEELASKFPGTKSSTDYIKEQGVDEGAPADARWAALSKGRKQAMNDQFARNPKGANTPAGTDPGLAEEGLTIASEPQIQRERVADDANLRALKKKNAAGTRELSNLNLEETINDLTERITSLKRVVKKGTATSLETDPRTGKQYPIAGYTKESIKQASEVITELEAKVANAKKILENGKKKLEKVKASKPNKAFGIAAMAGGLLAGTGAAGAAAFPPEDAEIFLGRINADKDFNRLNAREKAAVQKFLEYKAESDSIDARVDVPKGRSGRMDEPIEYTSAEKVKRSQ
jgi:hypothetical protein